MKNPKKRTALFLCAAILLTALSACTPSGSAPESESSQPELSGVDSSSGPAVSVPSASQDFADAVQIILSGGSASVEGKGAQVQGSVVTVTAGGSYLVSGSLEDGRIIVNAPGEDVTLALQGADIACSYGSPLYVYKAGTATVYLAEGTENSLEDGSQYTFDNEYSSEADEEPNACLYSKADLVIDGEGALKVSANCDNGITSKDTLEIRRASIAVTAVNNGINGKDSNTIDGAAITVSCGGDAIRSTNDTDETLGWVSVSNSTLALTAGEDGIQAETALTMSEGSYSIISGGGSGVQPSEETSAKGIKAGTLLNLTGGSYTLDCSDDAIHANGDVTVSGGSYAISTGDDALHADENLTVSGGEILIETCYEGLEGTTVAMSGGTVRVVSSDDGVNAAGGADGSGFEGFGRRDTFGNPDSRCSIDISGGYLVVEAGGDGLDSNGNAAVSGGTVIVSSTGQADGALDYDGSFSLTGGTLLAVSSGNMAQAPSEASQCALFLGFDSTLSQGTYVSLEGENQSFVLEMPASVNSMVFSCPDLESGAVYTVSYGGDYSGESADGICSGGTYSGGTELTELTLSEGITTYGNRGMDNMGNMGGRPDGNMGGRPWGDIGETPPEGEPPEGGMPDDLPDGGENPGGNMPGEEPPDGGPGKGHMGNREQDAAPQTPAPSMT